MTLAKKGSRPITIDGKRYRWTVRDRPTYAQGIGQSHLYVAVECAEAPSCILHIVLPALRRDNWLLLPGHVVKPNDLARWVPKALAAGWVPSQKGSAFELHLMESDLNSNRVTGEQAP